MMVEVFEFADRDDPAEHYIEAWIYEGGQRRALEGGLGFWLSQDEIHLGAIATELAFRRQGVATRLFDELRLQNPGIRRYVATVASVDGRAFCRALVRRHPDLEFDLRYEDGSRVSSGD